jgi:hypothetical protein
VIPSIRDENVLKGKGTMVNRKPHSFCSVVLLAGLAACSSAPPADQAKKAPAAPPDRIQGKAQVVLSETNATDTAMNAGGSSVYLWEGLNRYRLFFKSPTNIDGGKEYVAEGVIAQKAIDEIGDPDQGKSGYPLQSSCQEVVRRAWPGLAFDVTDLHASTLRARVQRYPARPVFLVQKLTPVEESGSAKPKQDADAAEAKIPEVTVPPEKQRALLIEGPATLPAPLWSPAGGTESCKVEINSQGKIAQLETGMQLCEAVPWSQYRFQPRMQGGHPVRVETAVEVRFEPRK